MITVKTNSVESLWTTVFPSQVFQQFKEKQWSGLFNTAIITLMLQASTCSLVPDSRHEAWYLLTAVLK